jgi:hypothetical protein
MGHAMAKSLADVRFAPQSGHRQLVPTSPLSANRDRTQRSKIHCLFDHLVGAAEQRKWDYRYIPDLDRIQDAAAEPAQEGRIGRFSWRASSSSPILIRQN